MTIRTPARDRILSAARRLVRRRGYAVVSLRQIAAAAKYSPAGLYAHFAGREAILDTVADEVRAELGFALDAAASREQEPVGRLVAVGQAYIAFAVAHPAEFELLFRYTQTRKRSLKDTTPSSFDLLRRIAREINPEATEDQVDVGCLSVWSTVHGLANLRLFHMAEFDGNWNDWSSRILRRQADAFT